jgi:glycosyltransferase involved in cell wall biosynthesis
MCREKSVAQRLSICIVTYPLQEASGSYYHLIINLLEVLSPLVHRIFLITGNFPEKQIENSKVHIINLEYKSKNSIMKKILPYLVIQIQISHNLAKINKKINGCVFILSGTLLLPTLVAKILKKKTVLTALASHSENAKCIYKETLFGKGAYLFSGIIVILEMLTRKFSNRIVVEAPQVVSFLKLNKYQNKICCEGCLLVNDEIFKPINKISKRKNIVGYIGRLSEEKGVLNFAKAIPRISEENGEIKLLVGGDGQLRDKIERYLEEENLNSKVKFTGWIPHDRLPKYLNELKLIVLPSYAEGLPDILLEAMACGCVVLSTSVGGIPDVIKDGETGFIMENNSPGCIAKNVIRALEHPNLEQIVNNARKFIEDEFTYKPMVRKWGNLLKGFSE